MKRSMIPTVDIGRRHTRGPALLAAGLAALASAVGAPAMTRRASVSCRYGTGFTGDALADRPTRPADAAPDLRLGLGVAVTSVSPVQHDFGGGSGIVIDGSGFAAGQMVTINDASLTELTLVNSTILTGRVPANPVGIYDLIVRDATTLAVLATLPNAVEYIIGQLPPPEDVEAVRVATGVQLTWSNPTFNDQITVKRDGMVAAVLAGNATAYLDDLGFPPTQSFHYEIIAEAGARTSASADVYFAPFRQDCLPFLPTGGSGRGSGTYGRLNRGIESQMCFHLDNNVQGLGFKIWLRRIHAAGQLMARIRSSEPPHLVLGPEYDGIPVEDVPVDRATHTEAIVGAPLAAGDYIVGFYVEGADPAVPSSFELMLDGFPEDPRGDCPPPNYPVLEITPFCGNIPPTVTSITQSDPVLRDEAVLDQDRFGGRMPAPALTYTLTADSQDFDGTVVHHSWLIGYEGRSGPGETQEYQEMCTSNGTCEFRTGSASSSIVHEFPFEAYWTVSATALDDAMATGSAFEQFYVTQIWPNPPCGEGPGIESLSPDPEECLVRYIPAVATRHPGVSALETFSVQAIPACEGAGLVPVSSVQMELAVPGSPGGLLPEAPPQCDPATLQANGQCRWWAEFNMSALPYTDTVELRVTATGDDGHQRTKTWTLSLCPLPDIFDYDDHEIALIDTTLAYQPAPAKYDVTATIPDVKLLDEDFTVPLLGVTLSNVLDAHLDFSQSLQGEWWSPETLHGRIQATLLNYDLFPTREFDIDFQGLDGRYSCTGDAVRYGPANVPIYSEDWAWEIFDTTLWEGFVGPVHVRVRGSLDVGMDLNISADVTLVVRTIQEAGEPVVEIGLVANPSITAWAAGEIRVEVFWGLASASVRLRPSISIALPVSLTSGVGENLVLNLSVNECFGLALDVNIRACAFGCVSSGWIPLFNEQFGSGCGGRAVVTARGAAEEPSDLKYPSIAVSPDGSTAMAVFVSNCVGAPGEHLPELYYSVDAGGGFSAPAALYSPADAFTQRDSSVVFLSNTKALAVWAQGSLTHAQELALPQTPAGGNTGFKNQDILCAVWDGTTGVWGPPQWITDDTVPNPLVPDGRPAAAPILNNVANPDAAWVAWVRSDNEDMIDSNGDAILSGMSIYARKVLLGMPSGGPIKVSAGDETDPAADIQPAVAVSPSGNVAAIVWVRDQDSDFDTSTDRFLMYSVWWGGGWSVPQAATVPSASPGALMPSIALSGDADGMVAFTVRDLDTNGEPLGEGNKDIVHTMRLSGGVFQNPVALERPPVKGPDEVARPVYGRDPQVRYLDAFNVAVVFRSFDGFGRRGGDGEVGVATVDLSQPDPKWSFARDRTDDDARDWDIAMAIGQNRLMRTVRDSTSNGAPGFCGLVFDDIACAPDLVVERIRLSHPHTPAGNWVTLTAVLRNNGLCASQDTQPHLLHIGRVVNGVFEPITSPIAFMFTAGPDRIQTFSHTFLTPAEATHLRVIAEPIAGETDTTNNTADVVLGVLPPTDLQCVQVRGAVPPAVRLRWANRERYDALLVFRNGRMLAELRGGRTTYLDTPVGPGDHEWSVRGRIGRGVSDPAGALCASAVVLPGDFDADGDVDLIDYTVFADCLGGPEAPPNPALPGVTPQDCLDAFDFDADADVDAADYATFQRTFDGAG